MPANAMTTRRNVQEMQGVLGIFVGGQSSRMGGIPKGMLPHPTESGTLVQRAARLGDVLGLETVLVGQNQSYESLGLPMLADSVQGIGPMGGLASLLLYATPRWAIALACDMPFVTVELLMRLCALRTRAPIVVPRRPGGLEPLCALYDGEVAAPAVRKALALGNFGLQRFIRGVGMTELALEAHELRWLDDWDSPEDTDRG